MTEQNNELQIINLNEGEFTPHTMTPAGDTWALVSRPASPEFSMIRPVVAWAWGRASWVREDSEYAESFITALLDMGQGIGTPAAELRASGYEVTTGPRAWVDAELADRRR